MWDLREVHACFDGENWVWNESFHYKNVFVDKNEDPKEIFWQECQMIFLQDHLYKYEIVDVDDGDILELQLKDSGEPVLAMIMEE
jgi:hypothetical protein